MSASSKRVQDFLRVSPLDIEGLGAELDAMNHGDRVAAMRGISGKQQAQIWSSAMGRITQLTDIVPAEVPPATEIIHEGKNSLPLFTSFQKRFCRPVDDDTVLYGYNEGLTRPLIGPGYFVAEYFDERGEVGVNYYKVPPHNAHVASGWPEVFPNEIGIQQFVFAKMIDYLRKVSRHVTIGRAYKHGEETPNYFLLSRAD